MNLEHFEFEAVQVLITGVTGVCRWKGEIVITERGEGVVGVGSSQIEITDP